MAKVAGHFVETVEEVCQQPGLSQEELAHELGVSFSTINLPLPAKVDIQKQVIRNAGTGEIISGDSCCEIEHLFYGLDTTMSYYQQEACVGGTKSVVK